jgi:hypothetical protein
MPACKSSVDDKRRGFSRHSDRLSSPSGGAGVSGEWRRRLRKIYL